MAAGFSVVDFKVIPNGDQLPVPSKDPLSGRENYRANVFIPSSAQLSTLRSYLSGVTIIDALGGGGIIVVERGPGKKTLTYPTANGGETSRSAILISVEAEVRMLHSNYIEAAVEFILVDS